MKEKKKKTERKTKKKKNKKGGDEEYEFTNVVCGKTLSTKTENVNPLHNVDTSKSKTGIVIRRNMSNNAEKHQYVGKNDSNKE